MRIKCSEDFCNNNKHFQKDGFYFRKSDSKKIQRYRCKLCGKRTSTAQLSPAYNQKKRTINHLVESLICSKVSYRRAAKILNVDKKTIHRKVIFLGLEARKYNQKFLRVLYKNKASHIQFDDLITKEKTKLKPLTISAAVDADKGYLLSFVAAQIPSFGHLAKISRKKYGKRKSFHKEALKKMFEEIFPYVDEYAEIRSDEHQLYPGFVNHYFPKSFYKRFPSIKGCVAGQGELKRSARDPLFKINHKFAMMRDDINRLVRRSWCVTQSVEMLQHHLEIYKKFHNSKLA
jgi:transposase-like protein